MRKSTLYLLAALALLISPAFPQGGMNLNDDAKLFLPPAGADFFPATKARFVVELNGTEQGVLCSGPTTIERGDPIPGEVAMRDTAAANGRNVIDTEIVALDLTCSGGVHVHLNPNFRSTGQINEQGDSFFDILVIHFTLVVNQAILGLAPLAAKIGAIERGLSKASGGVH